MATSAGRIMPIPKGAYDASVTYNVLDMVRYNGSTYICKQTCIGQTPADGAYWMLSAEGASGASVASFNGRTGAVVPVKNDYDIGQIKPLTGATQGQVPVVDANGDFVMGNPASSGHTIEDEYGTPMTARENLEFTGGATVTDDSANNRTLVKIDDLVTLTQAQYNNLSQAEKEDLTKLYFISDENMKMYHGGVVVLAPVQYFANLSDVNFTALADGEIPVYNSSSSKWKNQKLIGKKKYLLISDSYGGYTFDGVTYSWIDDVIENTGINATKLSVGSIGFRPPHDLVSSFQEILENAIENNTLGDLSEYTDIIVGGGANDITSVNSGAITKAQLIECIGDFVEVCKDNFPNANVYVGMIGNVKSSNFARAYYTVLEAYRDCRSVGASYLENVEYILGAEYIKSSDGIHPTPEGFVELKNYMSEAVITKSCNVNRPIQKMEGLNANDTTNVGAWNLVPDLWISINNGRHTMQFKRYGLGLTFVAANKLTFDSLVTEISYESYKLLAITELTIGHIKGGAYVTDHYEPYFCGKAHIKLTTTTLVDVFLDVPIAVVLGKLYMCLPSSVALAKAIYGNITGIDGSFLYCYILSAMFEIDGSNYNGTLAN